MAALYDKAILTARPRPRDKAKVEVAVLIIERWLLGRLSPKNPLRASDEDARVLASPTISYRSRPADASRSQLLPPAAVPNPENRAPCC